MSVLPNLNDEYPLTQAQIAEFEKNGHLLLRGVASPEEVEIYRKVITTAVERLNTETRPMDERDTYGKAFLQIMNIWRTDEGVKKFVFAKRFAKIAADLLQVDAIRLYHDQALYKEPGGGHTPWHQDQYYWPLETKKTVTMWMPLVDCSVPMGPMTFASGSHHRDMLTNLPISDDSQKVFDDMVKREGLTLVPGVPMNAGDVTFHAGWTLHSAPGNATQTMREVMTLIYLADGLMVSEPKNDNQKADLKWWFPGLKPGDKAASPINPVLYSRERLSM